MTNSLLKLISNCSDDYYSLYDTKVQEHIEGVAQDLYLRRLTWEEVARAIETIPNFSVENAQDLKDAIRRQM